MVAPSKIFHRPLNCSHCSQAILHPGIGCFRYFLNNLYEHGINGLKFFSPLLITPLLLQYKNVNRDMFINTLKNYLQTVGWASLASSFTFYCVCSLRNYYGRFRTYSTLFVPTFFSMQFCWFFPPRVLNLFLTATSQATLETLLRQYSNSITHLILNSSLVQILLFMVNSGIIMYYKRLNEYKDFWFIEPNEKLGLETTTNTQSLANCNHNTQSCRKFVFDGIKYGVYGILLDLLGQIPKGKLLTSRTPLPQKVIDLLKSFRPNMTGFLACYNGIYRLSLCFIRKYFPEWTAGKQNFVAAFMGGLSYACVNKVTIYTLSLVIGIQILWKQLQNKLNENLKANRSPNVALVLIKNLPFSKIIFSFNVAYLVHNDLLNNHLLSDIAKGFINAITNNKTLYIRNYLLKHDTEALLNLAQEFKVRTFF